MRQLGRDEQILARAAELVDRGWCRNALALDAQGRRVEPWSDRAQLWSPLGALIRAWYERRGESLELLEVACTAVSLAVGGSVEEWNAAPWRTKQHARSALLRAPEYLSEARDQVARRAPT